MANKSALFNITVQIYIPGTLVLQTATIPNGGAYRRAQKALPFFGAGAVSGETPVSAVQLWPTKL